MTPLERYKAAIFDAVIQGWHFEIIPGSKKSYLIALEKGHWSNIRHPIALLEIPSIGYTGITAEHAFDLVEQSLYCALVDKNGGFK